ncbi:unnamed protein product [Cunninghamella blakesleeana]
MSFIKNISSMNKLVGEFIFRKAKVNDLPAIIKLLSDDELGKGREAFMENNLLPECYTKAFQSIENDQNQYLLVVEHEKHIIGTLQISIIPGLSRKGALRGQIESVRVDQLYRSKGIGKSMFIWALDYCKQKDCQLVQLTTDKTRKDAHKFYDDLGFIPSHIGYKYIIKN